MSRKKIFISHASKDWIISKRICDLLEARGFGCWIAPRDISPGSDYGEDIIEAIESTALTVLVLSDAANSSTFVKNEIERAISKGKTVVPVRIEDVMPARGFELFISRSQWIDVWDSTLESAVDALVETVGLLSLEPMKPPSSPADVEENSARAETGRASLQEGGRFFGARLLRWVLTLLCVVAGLGMLAGDPAHTRNFPGLESIHGLVGGLYLLSALGLWVRSFLRMAAFSMIGLLGASLVILLGQGANASLHIPLMLLFGFLIAGRSRLGYPAVPILGIRGVR